MDFQTLPYVQDGKDGDIAATGFLVKKSSTDDTIVAGLKGNQYSDALLWGGGTVDDADHAANHNYVTRRGDKIPTLLKKDGTGKIGVFEINNNNIEINSDFVNVKFANSQDEGINDAEIKWSNSSWSNGVVNVNKKQTIENFGDTV